MKSYRMSIIGDHPKVTTGFAEATRPYIEAFVEAGHQVSVLGRLSPESCSMPNGYTVWGTPGMEAMGLGMTNIFLHKTKPDIIWTMTDPGNWMSYLAECVVDYVNTNNVKVVTYNPIEGTPINADYVAEFEYTCDIGGKNILWTKTALDELSSVSKYKYVADKYIYFGVDKAYQPYSEEDRQKLKRLLNLEGIFVIGSVGTNKRTKGMGEMLFVAQRLLQEGAKDFVFYQHTNPYHGMKGSNLKALSKALDVGGVVLWPPRQNAEKTGNYFTGVEKKGSILETDLAKKLLSKSSITTEESGVVIDMATMTDIYNMMDLYLDMSQIEGWGMPVMEAMACGTPVLSPRDEWVRDELFGDGRITYEPSTGCNVWESGARLTTIDVEIVTDYLLSLMSNGQELLQEHSKKGLESVKKFDWDRSKEEMVKEIESL